MDGAGDPGGSGSRGVSNDARNLTIAYLMVLLAGFLTATEWVGDHLRYHPASGGVRVGAHVIYGIKAHLIVQAFNDITEQDGTNNTILDNCTSWRPA